MNRDLAARLLALAFAGIAAFAAWRLVACWGEPGLRSVGRMVFILVLLELAAMAWRAPRLRPRRFREASGRLLGMLARPELHVAFAETSPQVSLVQAVLDDWDGLAREQARLPPGSLTDAESAALDDFARVIGHLRPSLLALSNALATELPGEEAWRLLVAAAQQASPAFPSPLGST